MNEILVNVPEYTVAQISGAVRSSLETAFGRIRVRGEVTDLRRYPSGHLYFSLKDEGGKLAAVAWKTTVHHLNMVPENGVEVVATGRMTAYADRSTYQLVVERIDYAGEGALLARIDALRRRLAAEGLFDSARKRHLPILPRIIGVVTSEQGAVIQDIRTTIARRFPRPILLWPVPVQGEDAAARIAAAITMFGSLPSTGPVPRPDVLIVARGGGSMEDLMAFNDESVVRAAAASQIPLISAVGHESDATLIDFAADRRAPTPTAAAEMAVPVRTELVLDLSQRNARLAGAFERSAQEFRLRLERLVRGLPDLVTLLGVMRQRLDDRVERLHLALPSLLQLQRGALATCMARLTDPRAAFASSTTHLGHLTSRLGAAFQRALVQRKGAAATLAGGLSPALLAARLREARAQLEGAGGRLASVSPDAVLARGYSLVFNADGHIIARAGEIRPGAALLLRFADGTARVTAAGPQERGQGGRDRMRQPQLPLSK